MTNMRKTNEISKSTHNVKVGRVGGAWVASDPGRTSSLHMDYGGAQAVDVRLGVMSSTQNQFWTHIHLFEKNVTPDKCYMWAADPK